MKHRLLLIGLVFISTFVNAQTHFNSLATGFTWYNYSWSKLNNRTNISGKAGHAVFVSYNKGISKAFSLTGTALLGRINDLNNSFAQYQNAEFAEVNLGIQTAFFKTQYKPNRVVPSIQFGYAFQQFFTKQLEDFTKLQTAVYMTTSLDFNLKNDFRIFASIGSNQKLNTDFRTYLKMSVGVVKRW